MKHIIRWSPFVSLVFISFMATAQVKVGPELGVNFAMQRSLKEMSTENSYSRSSTLKVGAIGGINVDIKIFKNAYVQTGVLYTYDNIKFKDAVDSLKSFGSPKMETSTGIHYFRVPLYLMYKSGFEGSGRFIIGAGPYVAYAFLANQSSSTPNPTTDSMGAVTGYTIAQSSSQLQLGSNKEIDQLKHWDYGVNACIGYEANVGMFFRGYFNWGFPNLLPGGTNTNKLQNWGLGITVGYNIGKDNW